MSAWLVHFNDPDGEMQRVSDMAGRDFKEMCADSMTSQSHRLGESCHSAYHFANLRLYQELHERLGAEADLQGHEHSMAIHSYKAQFFKEAHQRANLSQMLLRHFPKPVATPVSWW